MNSLLTYEVVDITVGGQLLKPVESWELSTKKVTENPTSTVLLSFITCLNIDQLHVWFLLRATGTSVFINSYFIFCVSLHKRNNSMACLLPVFINSFFTLCVSFYKRMNSMACLPAHQIPAHLTVNIIMLLKTTYNTIYTVYKNHFN